ncbi:MAG: crossover junction endodeoxyribonuclease RuvC [Vulcanimicrobiota bacterium]
MKILGIDPGIAITGYGVVEIENETPFLLEYGGIKTKKGLPKPERLRIIHSSITDIVKKHKPDIMVIELLFFNRNTKTALTVGEARGIALLVAGQNDMEVFEYTPLQVKESLTGYGRVKKNELREMVQLELDLEKPPKPIDASDALAIALCHYYLSGLYE